MKKFLRRFIKEHWLVITILILANLALFWQFYLRKLLPFPGDLLVSFFFPWSSGGFAGFDPWTTRKEVIAADVIRQMYPWQVFAFDLIKNHHQLPLWDPYNFSGYPLIANLQSAIFFVGNILTLLLPILPAWIIMVVSTISLFGFFVYLFLRSLKISRLASTFGALCATNLSLLTIWQEQLVFIRPALFLPLILWATNMFWETKKKIFYLLIPVFSALAILAGHAQMTIYVFIITAAFMFFRRIPIKTMIIWFAATALLGAIQLLPTLELYLQSAREGLATHLLFAPYVLPWQNLITAFAPDFFGNVATNNFWGQHYPDFLVYFGITTLILAAIGIVHTLRSQSLVRFFFLLALAGLLFSTWPLAFLIDVLHIPILATGAPARGIFLLQFSAPILAAYGFDWWFGSKARSWRSLLMTLFPIGLVYFLCWVLVFLVKTPQFLITRSNLILPTIIFLLVTGALVISIKLPQKLKYFTVLAIFTALVLEATYQFNKYQPFAPAKFVFPNHPIISYLQQQAGINRYFGFGGASIDQNFATYYHIFAAEGYDSLYIKRYGELLASTANGSVPAVVPRSVAVFGDSDNYFRNRLFDLLGVKYILEKNDNYRNNFGPEYDKFPPDHYQLVWQQDKWQVYQRTAAYPRVFLAGSYEIITNPNNFFTQFYNPDFNPRQTVILEQHPTLEPDKSATGSAQVLDYQPNTVTIQTTTTGPMLLFLSDAFYPGWSATIDGASVPIYRADYALRAISAPPGTHTIIFNYDPISFKIGVLLSLGSLAGVLLYFLKK